MAKVQKNTIIFGGLITVILAVYVWQFSAMWQLYAPSSDVTMFRSFFGFYYSAYAFVAAGALWLVAKQKDGRPILLGVLLCALLFASQQFSLSELVDFRTYSYEIFIVSFYVWLAALLTLMLSAFIYPASGWKIAKYAAGLTVVMIIFFAFTGRGSIEHLLPMVGGLYKEHSWVAARVGKLIYLVPVFVVVGVVFPLLNIIYNWAVTGKVGGARIGRSLAMTLAFVAIIALSLISLPIGNALNNNDVVYTKKFVDELRVKVDQYKADNGSYPLHILDILKGTEAPRLLKRYDYLANNTKGGYFLSRESKYCFIFQDPGKAFGYYSVTSDRPWRFSHEGQDLTEKFLAVCDEGEMMQADGLVAGHLGLDNVSSPIQGMMLELEDQARRPPVTQGATKLLEDRIEELGKIDPSIYGESGGFDNGYQGKSGEMVRTTQELKRALINGPIEEPEF